MKRDLHKLIAFIAILFLPFALFAQTMDPAYGIVIDESFEKGIPADWTQENVSGSMMWVAENSDLTYPTGAYDSLGRAAFRNTTGVTQKAVTRLILPAKDISALFQPILTFSHAQDKWSGDFDSLRVLCRTSENGTWNTLAAYDNYIAKWQRDTLFLPAQSYVQIAFEAIDNLGRGVVIDDVVVRSTPSCFDPEDIYTSGVNNHSITVNWSGSFDAEYFYVKLSKTPLTEADLANPATELVCDTTTDGISMFFDGLKQGTRYYCYIRSQCEHEISGWVSHEFKTANLAYIPDTITFNIYNDPEQKGKPAYMDGWYYDASDPIFKPYVNAYLTDWKYGSSSDGTASLIFTYYTNSSTGAVSYTGYLGAIPANAWAYAASPEMNVPVKDLQITFETFIYYDYIAEQFGITVGVMDDPEDRSTFVPIKTIINDRLCINSEYVVSFENYTGNGRYIAFMSDFGKTNHFCIDNLIIEPNKGIGIPNYDISMPSASTMQFHFEEEADSYEVVITSSNYNFDRNQDFPDSLTYVKKETIANHGKIEDLTPDARYRVYARMIKGDKKGKWSLERYEEMPSRFDITTFPYKLGFENISVVNSIDINGYSTTSSISIPKIIKPLYTYGSSAFKVSDSTEWVGASYLMAEPMSKKDFAIACYYPYEATTIAVFPEVDMTQTKVSFYGVGRMPSIGYNPASNTNYKSRAIIGAMTDANDMTTFVAVDTIDPDLYKWTYYEYDFSTYAEAAGTRFFAIKMDGHDFTYTSRSSYTNKIHVDNMVFAKAIDCKSPSNVEAVVDVNDPSKATITWTPNGVTSWNVKVAKTEYNKDSFDIDNNFEFIYEALVTTPKVELTGLQYPYHTYYYWIQPVCDGVAGEWSAVACSFETFCPAVHPIPYVQNFDDAKAGSRIWTGFTVDCAYTKQWKRTVPNATPSGRYDNYYYYPSVTNTISYSGDNSFPIFKKYSTSSRNYIALPELAKPIDSLQISFRLYSKLQNYYWKYQELAVGVMTDPMDINTFEQVALVVPSKQDTWERIVVKFDEYVGQGKHIAIRETDKFSQSPTNSSKYAEGANTDSVYIDNIEVNIAAPCDMPYDIFASDVTANSAKINWKSDAKEFIVLVTDKVITYNDLLDFDDYKAGNLASFAHESSIVFVDTVINAKSVSVPDLEINKDYYVYIKAFCGLYTDYAVDYTFSTFCPTLSAESFIGNFTDAAKSAVPDCWFAGFTHGSFSGSNKLSTYIQVTENSYTYPAQGRYLMIQSTNGALNNTYNVYNPNGMYVITPSIDIDQITKYKVSFKAWTTDSYKYTNCGTNDYARSIVVGVVTNPYDMSTFVPVDTIENIHRNPYPYEVAFNTYKCDLNGEVGKFVAFYSNFGIRNQVYLDDVVFELIDNCPTFEAQVTSRTTSSVTIDFAKAPASYVVKVSKDNIVSNFSELNNDSLYKPFPGTSSSITIDSLVSHREYFFYARSAEDSICDEWQILFTDYAADFEERNLPFTDDFESNYVTATYGECPHDWYGYYYQEGDLSYPTVSTSGNNSTRGVYAYASGAGKNVYMVTPKLNVDNLAKCYLQFDVKASNVSSYPTKIVGLIIGAVSNLNDIPNSFEPIDTLILQPEQLGVWVTLKLELAKYAGSAKHLAILTSYDFNKELFSTYAYTTCYYDNVIVDLVPNCYNPYDFKLASATDESLFVNFEHEGALKYEAMYGYNGFSMDSLSNEAYKSAYQVKTMEFTGTEFEIESLLSETTYSVYVRAICTANDTSEWMLAGAYKTLPALISSFPYTNDFSDSIENAKWKARYSKGDNPYGYRLYFGVDSAGLVADKKNMTDAALYYSYDGGKTPTHEKVSIGSMVYRYINLTEGYYKISFDWVFPSTPRITTSQFIADHGLFRVLLMPSTTTFGSSVSQFISPSGKSVSLSYIDPLESSLPADFFDLSKKTYLGEKVECAFYGTDITKPLEEQWQHHTADLTITKEQEGTYMLVFYYYGVSASMDAVDPDEPRILAVDDLSIIKSECGSVFDVKVNNYTTNTANFSWTSSDSTITSYDVLVLNADVDPTTATEAQKAYTGTSTTMSAAVTGLNSFTTYYVYVRPTCNATYNFWSEPAVFTTDLSVPEGYTFSFEEEEQLFYPPYVDSYVANNGGDQSYINKITMFHHWLTRSMIDENNTSPSTYKFSKSYANYYPQVVEDTLLASYYYMYGRTGTHALWLGSRTTTSYMNGATVAMPYAGDFENKRLIFYMRPFNARIGKTSTAGNEMTAMHYPYYSSSTVSLSKQSRKITVGTMTDPNDAHTFVPLDTIQYPYLDADYGSSTYFKNQDASGEQGWYRAVVSLANAKGKYIAFRYEWYGTATTDKTVNMYIDDVTVAPIPECPAPELMKINKVKESSVEVDYFYEGGTPTTAVVIATDENFTNIVKRDTFNTLPFTVTGLTPLTQYYLKAQVVCSDLDQSLYSSALSFETPVAICYDNNFDNEPTHYPSNWSHSYSPSLHYFMAGTSQISSLSVPSASSTYGWKIGPAMFKNGKFSSRHMVATPYPSTSSSLYTLWATTQPFQLDEDDAQHLSFDLALTAKGESDPIDLGVAAADTNYAFAVVIVDDATYTTYKRSNYTIWKSSNSKMKPEYEFASIPNTGKEYSIDLTPYKGKNIRVLFYFAGRDCDIHLDNVHINTYVEKEYEASTCEFCDFEDNNFFVLSSNTQVGENKFSKWAFDNEDPDTLLTLNLNVGDVSETELSATICEGDVYNKDGFTGLVNQGVYRRKFTSVGKCDSLVTLNLNVVKPQVTTLIDTICFGTSYNFNGTHLNRTGLYADTLVSVVTGCDSIVNLVLTVKDVIRKEHYVNICFGETYTFGKQTISASGTYEELFKTVDGCDSLVTLHATVLPDYRQTINAVIKKGEEYNANGFRGLTEAGEYTLPLKSVDGCDSTVILVLKVLSDVSNTVSMNLCFGDTYVFGSQTITKGGEYVEVFKAADGGDSTVILTVTALPDLRQTIEATICAGETYNENGFSNLKESGEYKLPLTSVDGCDSTVTLTLTVLSGDTTYVEKSITTAELPYEYQSIRYDKSTKPGKYVDTIVVKTGNCEEVIIHTLIISSSVAVDNATTRDLIMVPNPVAVNGTLYINAEFTSEERNGLIVEVFNAIGQCVYTDVPTVYPIQVTGLAERGMYIVRIITGDGKSYQGKIIVE